MAALLTLEGHLPLPLLHRDSGFGMLVLLLLYLSVLDVCIFIYE